MSRALGLTAPERHPASTSRPDRRRFLSWLGLAAGVAALGPLLRARAAGSRSGDRLEAGRPALGTWLRMVVRHPEEAVARRALERAFAAVREVDAQMSVHRADSELSRANASAGRAAVPASPALRTVAALACAAAGRSGGVYDPTVLPLMKLYGFYGAERSAPPTAREVDAVLARVDAAAVRIDESAGTLALLRGGAGLDLGSIGKGWAVDRAVAAIRAEGVRAALVDLGGNVYGLGAPDESAAGWSVGAFHPATGELARVFVLRDAAVATSGNSEQSRMLGDVRIGHLFDARRGLPADGHQSVSVVARTAVESDVASTSAFLLGPDRFRGWPGVIDSHFIG